MDVTPIKMEMEMIPMTMMKEATGAGKRVAGMGKGKGKSMTVTLVTRAVNASRQVAAVNQGKRTITNTWRRRLEEI